MELYVGIPPLITKFSPHHCKNFQVLALSSLTIMLNLSSFYQQRDTFQIKSGHDTWSSPSPQGDSCWYPQHFQISRARWVVQGPVCSFLRRWRGLGFCHVPKLGNHVNGQTNWICPHRCRIQSYLNHSKLMKKECAWIAWDLGLCSVCGWTKVLEKR